MQGRILVKEIKPESKTAGGLILPQSATERSLMKGVVLELGIPTPDYDCSGIQEGSVVLFVMFASAEVGDDMPDGRILRYEDVVCTVIS